MVTADLSGRYLPSSVGSFDLVDRLQILRFAASFAWADCKVVDEERKLLSNLARELALDDDPLTRDELESLLSRPPSPSTVDPNEIRTKAMADAIRRVALCTIAIDGQVEDMEMNMFELLDDLLPRSDDDTERDLARSARESFSDLESQRDLDAEVDRVLPATDAESATHLH